MHQWFRRSGVVAAVGCAAMFGCATMAAASAPSVHARTHSHGRSRALTGTRHTRITKRMTASLKPKVRWTGRGPTGYQVTFSYYAPSATSVQIKGEWYFSNQAGTTTSSSLGLLPAQWSPGD